MISAALCNQRADAEMLEQEIRNEAAIHTDEKVFVKKLLNKKMLEEFLKDKGLVDFICIDVTIRQGIYYAELMREHYPEAAIVLVADLTMSPVTYMKPSIMAAALLLKPLAVEPIRNTMDQLFEYFVDEITEEDVFVVETKEDRQRIRYSSILYFEARAKKIYVCTADSEYGFYDTMEQLEKRLSDTFLRCHRSYIVNRQYIKKVMISRGIIMLQDNIEIPLSRSYKGVLKENVEWKQGVSVNET